MPVQTPESGLHRPFSKMAGTQPLPGYTLLDPLGRGGFGEVWKCEAPGGLLKAVKFVAPSGEGHELRQELGAFEQIKAIRHPFLLTLERVELVDDELVMVMELADCQLQDRYRQCQDEGLAGIPRDELLGYLADAAEALDVIGSKYGLQHLDVKPANLFLTSGRVKVGDYGLVSRLEGGKPVTEKNRGLTPKYVAPEVLRGSPSPRSDQYSLALVYQELLTGTFPYMARNPQHMMLQHITSAPNLDGLPECDQETVRQALSKNPDERFGFCLEFVRSLLMADPESSANPALAIRKARMDRGVSDPASLTGRHPMPADPSTVTGRHRAPGELTQNHTLASATRMTQPGRPLPPLISANLRRPSSPSPSVKTPPPVEDDLPLAEVEDLSPSVKLDRIRSVVPTVRLLGPHWAEVRLSAMDFVAALYRTAAGDRRVPVMPGDFGQLADGTWTAQFPSTVPHTVAPLKLSPIGEYWGLSVVAEPSKITFRKLAPAGLWGSFSSKKSGVEVTVALPAPGRSVGEVVVNAGLFGSPDATFARAAQELIPNVLTGIKRELANVQDRRRQPRLSTDLPVTIYPLHGDGRVESAISGHCRDVSHGGICFATPGRLPASYAYVSFDRVFEAEGLALLLQVLRSKPDANNRDQAHAGQFRTDL